MHLTKKVPYKINKLNKLKTLIPALGLAGATILGGGCKDKNEHEITPEPQPETEQPTTLKKHDTVYMFGSGNWWDETEKKNIIASADSITVRYVVLESDGKDYVYKPVGVIKFTISRMIKKIPAENQHKIKGCGILRNLNIDSKEDSIYLANMGFKFVKDQNYQR